MSLLDKRWPWLAAVGLIVLAVLSTMIEFNPVQEWDDRPVGSIDELTAMAERDDLNVLFVLVDTMRAERLSAYGHERETSPFLAKLAEGGIRFERHLAQSSWTKTSMASMWTGLYPAAAGITTFDQVLPDDALMPAEVFREAGFRTAGIYRNGWVAPSFGFGQGFEIYQRSQSAGLPPHLRRENPTLSSRSTDEAVVRSATEFMRLRGDERWFLYLHLMDLHEYIYDFDSAKFGSSYVDIYDNSILWTDRTIELLLERLSDLGYLDRTIVVITSDHGEAFGERGWEGHGRRVYRETTEIPWIVSLPFKLDQGVVVQSRTANVDVWPTLFEMLGIEAPANDGRSRVEAIRAAAGGAVETDHDEDPAEVAYAHLDTSWGRPGSESMPTVAVVDGPLRFVRVDADETQTEELFDASQDPREMVNIIQNRTEDATRLGALVDEYMKRTPPWPISTRTLSELELGQLRALGYDIE